MSTLANIFSKIAGQESQDLDLSVVAIPEVAADAAAEAVIDKEIAEHDRDIAEHDHAIEKLETAIEAVEDKQEELEEIVDGLESMMTGATPFNAALFHDKMARGAKISAKFGAPLEIQGAESFADASTANLNAFAGIESMKETATKAAGAVKQFFVQLYQSFIAVIEGLLNRFKGLEQKANVLKSAMGSKEVAGDKVKLPKSAAVLNEKGHAGVTTAILAGLGKVYQGLDGLGGSNEDGPAKAVEAVAEALAGMGSKSVASKTETTETLEVKVNGVTVKIVSPLTDAGVGSASFTVSAGEAPGEITALGKPALVQICSEVAADAKKLQAAKLDKRALTQLRDRAIAEMEKRAAAHDASKEDKKAATSSIKDAHKASLKLGRAALGFGGDVLDAQLAFVKAHVGSATAKKEEAAAE